MKPHSFESLESGSSILITLKLILLNLNPQWREVNLRLAYRSWGILIEQFIVAAPKPFLNEFAIDHRLESCDLFPSLCSWPLTKMCMFLAIVI